VICVILPLVVERAVRKRPVNSRVIHNKLEIM
jgi:hypothetical protein